jgi:hypothetical protein
MWHALAVRLEYWLLWRAETTVIALKRGRWIDRKRAARLLGLIDARLIEGHRCKHQPRRSK